MVHAIYQITSCFDSFEEHCHIREQDHLCVILDCQVGGSYVDRNKLYCICGSFEGSWLRSFLLLDGDPIAAFGLILDPLAFQLLPNPQSAKTRSLTQQATSIHDHITTQRLNTKSNVVRIYDLPTTQAINVLANSQVNENNTSQVN